MIETLNKYLCSTCKSKCCDKGIVIIRYEDIKVAKCSDYEKDETKVKGFERQYGRTAKQIKPLMRFRQEY